MVRTRSGKNTGKLHSVVRQTPTILNISSAKMLAMLMATSKNFRNIIKKNKPSQNRLNNAKRHTSNIQRILTSRKPFQGYAHLYRSNVKNAKHLYEHGNLINNMYQTKKYGSKHVIDNNTRGYHLYRTGRNLNTLKKTNKTNIGRNNNNDIVFTNARNPNLSYTLEKEFGRLYAHSHRAGQSRLVFAGVKPKNIFSNANIVKVLQ
jgi:hypothetical protein